MTRPYLLITFLLLLSSSVFAQIIAVSGKVTDGATGLPIAGASVKIGNSGTSTDKGGGFNMVLDKATIGQNSIAVSCIGYQKKIVTYKNDQEYDIKLSSAINALGGVTISDGESVIQKAVRRIPKNYPVKDFMTEGFLRMYHITKDSAAYYKYYKNDAVIKMLYTSYLTRDEPKIVLLQNKVTDLNNTKLDKDTLRWVNSYLAVYRTDMVRNPSYILAPHSDKKYSYIINGKDWVNGSRVYVVNFFSKKQNDQAGTLYIDTASYAIVKTELTLYNVKSLIGTAFKKSYTVNYKKLNGRWYLDNVKANASAVKKGLDQWGSIDYKTILIDTLHTETLAYNDVIPNRSEDAKINNPGTAETQAKYAPLFKSAATDSLVPQIPVPFVDTAKAAGSQHKSKGMLTAILNYLQHDNVRSYLAFSKLPFTIDENQPALSNSVDDIANYSLDIGKQLRIHNQLFFDFDLAFNLGLGGLNNHSITYGLLYNFQFNKTHRPITTFLSVGFSSLTLSKSGTDYYKQSSVVPGIALAIERSRTLSYFVQVKYYGVLDTEIQGIRFTQQNFAPTVGLRF